MSKDSSVNIIKIRKNTKKYGCEQFKNLAEDKIQRNMKKNLIKWEKLPYYNYNKLFSCRKFGLFLGLAGLEKFGAPLYHAP